MATILVVDDSRTCRASLTAILAEAHHRVLEANNGEQALAVVRAERPDLVISDLLMPVLDGYGFVRELRADPTIAHTSVIITTAEYLQDEVGALAQAGGILEILTKSSEAGEVLRAVTSALSRPAPSLIPPMPPDFDQQHLRLLTDKLARKVEELESEDRFRSLLEAAPDAMVIVSNDGRITLVNRQAERMFAYPRAELVGQEVELLVPERFRAEYAERRRSYLGAPSVAQQGANIELLGRRQDDSEFPVEIRLSPLVSAGEPLVILAIRDITERQQASEALRRSEERARQIIDTAFSAFVSMDADGTITAWNPQAEAIFGWSRAEALGRNLAETIVPPQSRTAHQDGLLHFLATGQGPVLNKRIQVSARHRDGHEFPVELTITSLRQGETLTFNAFIQDITNRKRAENKLKTFAAELARSNRELQDFANVASHDLQEPLRKIQTFGDRLQSKHGDSLSADGRDALARMQNAAGRMRTLINDLLEFSRVSAKPARLVQVNLRQVMHEVLSDLEGRLHATAGRVEVGELPSLEAEPTQMRQLLQNLVGNALKFHRPHEPPVVKIQSLLIPTTSDGTGVALSSPIYQITVQDNGIGFDESDLDRIFRVFQRLHGRSEYEGTGIGLAICRRIVERHGGSISASSKPGHGTTFTVFLPAKQSRGERSHEEPHRADHDSHGR